MEKRGRNGRPSLLTNAPKVGRTEAVTGKIVGGVAV